MSLQTLLEHREEKNHRMRIYVENAYTLYDSFFDEPYSYNEAEAIEALGIESDLVQELLEDFAVQLIQSNVILQKQLHFLNDEQLYTKELDFTPFRNTIHKNLGVARNLRIKDCVMILNQLMIETDLESIEALLKVLESCALKISPHRAYEALQLINKVT